MYEGRLLQPLPHYNYCTTTKRWRQSVCLLLVQYENTHKDVASLKIILPNDLGTTTASTNHPQREMVRQCRVNWGCCFCVSYTVVLYSHMCTIYFVQECMMYCAVYTLHHLYLKHSTCHVFPMASRIVTPSGGNSSPHAWHFSVSEEHKGGVNLIPTPPNLPIAVNAPQSTGMVWPHTFTCTINFSGCMYQVSTPSHYGKVVPIPSHLIQNAQLFIKHKETDDSLCCLLTVNAQLYTCACTCT